MSRYNHAVRSRAIEAAMLLMQRAGLDVTVTGNATETTINVVNKQDSLDPHGARYLATLDTPNVRDTNIIDVDTE